MLVYSRLCVVWLHRLQPVFISLWLCSVVNWVYKVRYYVINTFIVSVRFWPAVADKCWRFSGKFDCDWFDPSSALSERYWDEFMKQIFCDDHASRGISRKQNSAGAERGALPRLTHRALIMVISFVVCVSAVWMHMSSPLVWRDVNTGFHKELISLNGCFIILLHFMSRCTPPLIFLSVAQSINRRLVDGRTDTKNTREKSI